MPKNTVLGEDAEIYQKRNDSKELEKLKGLPLRKKIGYFKDYYFKIVTVGGIALAVVIYLIYMLVRPKDDMLLHAVILNDSIQEENMDSLVKNLGKTFGYDDVNPELISIEDNLILDATYPNEAVLQQIAVYTYAGTLDIMIADKENFTSYAKKGFFLDLSEILTKNELETLKDDILYETLDAIPEEDLISGEEQIDTTTEHAYGICLDSSKLYTSLSTLYEYQKDSTEKKSLYIGIAANSDNVENATAAIEYLEGLKIQAKEEK